MRTRTVRNPELKAPSTAAVHVSVDNSDPECACWTFVVYDTAKMPDTKSAWIATGILTHCYRGLVSTVMAARPGYGPLLYTYAATYTGVAVLPSEERSDDALRFWSRQPGGYVPPMTDEAFALRFGKGISALETSSKLTKRQIEALIDVGVQVSEGAKINPRSNPEKKAPPRTALWVRERKAEDDPRYRHWTFILYDASKLPSVESAWIGTAVLEGYGAPLTSVVMAAVRGYGPLLYTTAATRARAHVVPSDDRSEHALRFWSRQPNETVLPLRTSDFELRFGKRVASMEQEHLRSGITNRALREMEKLGYHTSCGG